MFLSIVSNFSLDQILVLLGIRILMKYNNLLIFNNVKYLIFIYIRVWLSTIKIMHKEHVCILIRC